MLVKVHKRPKTILNTGRYLEKFDPRRAKIGATVLAGAWQVSRFLTNVYGHLPLADFYDLLEADRCASASDCKEDTIKSAG